MGLIVRLLLVVGGLIAAWFVPSDAPNYAVVQGLAAVVVLAGIVLVIAFLRRD